MRRIALFLLAAVATLVLAACTEGAVQPNTVTYALDPVNNSGVEGLVTFEEESETETTVTIDVDGTTQGVMHPAHLHVGDVGTGGAIEVSLEPVDGDTGESVTLVSREYEDLVNFDGYVDVHAGPADDTVVSAGEIGEGANAIQVPLP